MTDPEIVLRYRFAESHAATEGLGLKMTYGFCPIKGSTPFFTLTLQNYETNFDSVVALEAFLEGYLRSRIDAIAKSQSASAGEVKTKESN